MKKKSFKGFCLNKKKGQMELLGIAVIVVFLALGIYFVVRFNILKEPGETKKIYTQSEIASNMLSALVATTAVDCGNIKMLELIIDCADYYSINGSNICRTANNKNATCEYMNYTISRIFNQTLDTWGKNYIFNITTEAGPVYSMKSQNCSGNKRAGQFFFPTGTRGLMLIELDVCD